MDLIGGVGHKEDVYSLCCFISKRIAHIDYYSLAMYSGFLGFSSACSLLSRLVALSFESSHAVGLVLLGSIVQNSLVSQGQCMLQQGGLGV